VQLNVITCSFTNRHPILDCYGLTSKHSSERTIIGPCEDCSWDACAMVQCYRRAQTYTHTHINTHISLLITCQLQNTGTLMNGTGSASSTQLAAATTPWNPQVHPSHRLPFWSMQVKRQRDRDKERERERVEFVVNSFLFLVLFVVDFWGTRLVSCMPPYAVAHKLNQLIVCMGATYNYL